MAPLPPRRWLANITAPKRLISLFPHPMSSSCCSPLTTVALRRASTSDMRVRLRSVVTASGRSADRKQYSAVGIASCTAVRSPCCYIHTSHFVHRCENGVGFMPWSWYSSQWASPWQQLLHWLQRVIHMWPGLHTEWSGTDCLRTESSVESRSPELWWWGTLYNSLSFFCWRANVSINTAFGVMEAQLKSWDCKDKIIAPKMKYSSLRTTSQVFEVLSTQENIRLCSNLEITGQRAVESRQAGDSLNTSQSATGLLLCL